MVGYGTWFYNWLDQNGYDSSRKRIKMKCFFICYGCNYHWFMDLFDTEVL